MNTRDAARLALALAAGDNTQPMYNEPLSGNLFVTCPRVFDVEKDPEGEAIKALAKAAGVKVHVLRVNLSTLEVHPWEFDGRDPEADP